MAGQVQLDAGRRLEHQEVAAGAAIALGGVGVADALAPLAVAQRRLERDVQQLVRVDQVLKEQAAV